MPFKLNFQPSPVFGLAEHGILLASGNEAQLFLQSQCMNDVASLADGQWQYNGWLNPQGRVMALFYLLKIDATHFYLVIPRLNPNLLLTEMQRFVFRTKVRLSIETEMSVNAEFVPPSKDQAKTKTVGEADLPIAWRPWGSKGQRRLYLSQTPANSSADQQALWQSCDIALGWPWIGEPQRGLWTPHMLSLERLESFSLKKGCYPGQEIVARTHYLGKSKRALKVVLGQGLLELQGLQHNGSELGKVVSVGADGSLAIAVLPADSDDSITLSNPSGPVSVSTLELC